MNDNKVAAIDEEGAPIPQPAGRLFETIKRAGPSSALGREILWHSVIKTLFVLFTSFARVRVVFYHPLPKTGFILAANHVSHFDPPILTPFFPRQIDWIGMVELFHGKFLHGFFTGLNVIPVDRAGSDRAALRTAVKRLQAGRVVGIFPEGGIRDGAASIVNGGKMKEGVALLASLSGAPIIPCVILGSDRLYNKRNWLPWRRVQICVGCGPAIHPPDDLSGEQKRRYIQSEFAAGIVRLKERLCADFQLGDADLPHSPQQRMMEP